LDIVSRTAMKFSAQLFRLKSNSGQMAGDLFISWGIILSRLHVCFDDSLHCMQLDAAIFLHIMQQLIDLGS